jgi:hypothetical protein
MSRHVSMRGGFLFCSSASNGSLQFPARLLLGNRSSLFLFRILGGFVAQPFLLGEVLTERTTGVVGHVDVLGFGDRF